MIRRLRPPITYANVVSSLCLFIVLGGAAYAAAELPENSVGTKQLQKGAVTSGKVRNETLLQEDVAPGQFATPASLAGLVHGTAHLVTKRYDVTANGPLLSIPGGGKISIACGSGGYSLSVGGASPSYDVFRSITVSGNPAVISHYTTANQFIPSLITQSLSVWQFDVASTGGGAAVTAWGRFTDANHCLGRIRALTFP